MAANMDYLLEWYRRRSIDPASPRPAPIESLAIIGAGLMGVEIAAANLRRGLRVLLTDANPQTLAAARERIAAEMDRYERPGFPKENNFDRLLETTNEEDRLGGCDLIIETVVEDPAVKRQIFGRLEPRMAHGSLLATNTSTIPIGELAAELREPGRFCGIHFCHPVHVNPLVEIIPGPRTDSATVSAAADYAKMLGKMPIVVEDGPGFVVNRLLLRYTDEAMHLLLDGAEIEQIDRAATEFGMALGPLRILDEIGLDTSLAAGRVMLEAFPDRVARLPLLPLLVKRKQLGRKSGGGFYRYAPALPSSSATAFAPSTGPNPETQGIVEHYARRENPPSEEKILQRLLLAMVSEAAIILQEKKRLDPREIDLCMICGLGFPADQGGLLHWADEIGASNILEMLEGLESLGARFRPAPLLRELAKRQGRFYSND
jgi:3-hydroxyacyl-CoA dehydrogenase